MMYIVFDNAQERESYTVVCILSLVSSFKYFLINEDDFSSFTMQSFEDMNSLLL